MAVTIAMSRAQLKAWLIGQLQSMSGPNLRTTFRYRGVIVCKNMFMRVHGVGEKMMRRARALFVNNMSFDTRAFVDQTDQQDVIYVMLIQFFITDCETTADGIWHLQDIQNFPMIVSHVKSNWSVAVNGMVCGARCKPESPPGEGLIRLVLRRDFQQVKWVRDGNYSICTVCGELATQQRKGFKSEAEALKWRQKTQVHNKVHRANRVGSMNSEYTS